MANPKLAIDTILEDEIKIDDNLVLQNLTLARMALLELTNSPFIDAENKFTWMNLIPSFYIMTQTKESLKGYNSKNIDDLIENSMIWAECLKPESSNILLNKILEKFGIMNKVTPQTVSSESESPKNKKESKIKK